MSFFQNSNKPASFFQNPLNAETSGSKPANNAFNPLSNNALNPNPPSNSFNPPSNPLNPPSNPLNPPPNTLNPSNPLNPSNSNAQSNALFGGKPAPNIFGSTSTLGSGGGINTNPITSSSSTASGGIFGNRPSSTTPSGGLFGGGSSLGDATKPTGSGTSTAAPSTNTLFGNAASTPSGGSIFGGPTSTTPKPTEGSASNSVKPSIFGSTTTSTAPATGGSSTGGLFGLPTKPAESSTATTSPPITQPAAGTSSASTGGTGLFGGGGLFGKPAASTTTTAPTTTSSGTTTLPAGSLFGSKPAEKKDTPAPAAPGPLNLFGTKKDTPTSKPEDKSITAPVMNLPTVAVPPPSALKGKTLEEIVNRWSSDLETHAREFNRYAAEVAVWDRALIENGNTLSALYSHIAAAERQQDNIDQSLGHIEQQQNDLAATLDAYEKMSQELLGIQSGSLRTLDTGPADTERDKNYMLATDLHAQLDDLSGSLTQMIDAVNGLSISNKPNGESNDDPMTQISQVLSSHLESLQWIDGAVREVEGKVSDVEKRVKDSGYNLNGGPNQGKSRGFGLHR
ncbi:hypothetical protein Agabi119p4_4438 [Agaricus bisporus var. burnettii]|uniref:Nucleoporin NSP1 n=1 Tax=Agaricus bisporus var. burnettii TaxID=192524 RepID=A0A8H7F350_AGABI|nr:hypothetical protein Agabi119p4_4438 [Agaricus bisporus var. burnettii]